MKNLYRFCVFLLFAALLAGLTTVAFGGFITAQFKNLQNEDEGRLVLAAQDGGDIYLLRSYEGRAKSGLAITLLEKNGDVTRTGLRAGLPDYFTPTQFYVNYGRMLIGGYEKTEGETALVLYAANHLEDGFRLLLREECGFSDRDAARLSSFSAQDGTVRFFVATDRLLEFYETDFGEGLVSTRQLRWEERLRGGILTDVGTAYLAAESGALYVLHQTDEAPQPPEAAGYNFTAISEAAGGFFFLDAAEGALLRFDEAADESVLLRDTLGQFEDAQAVSLSAERIVLIDGQARVYSSTEGEDFVDITSDFYPGKWKNVLIILAIALFILILAFALCYAFCIVPNHHFPILLRSFLLIGLLAGFGVRTFFGVFLAPAYTETARQGHLDALTAAAQNYAQTSLFVLPDVQDADYLMLKNDGGLWRVGGTTTAALPSDALLTTPGLPGELMRMATEAQEAPCADLTRWGGGLQYTAAAPLGGGYRVAVATIDAAEAEAQIAASLGKLERQLYLATVIAVAAVMLVLLPITNGIRRLQKAMNLLGQGHHDVVVVQKSGDELQMLAHSVNSHALRLGNRDEGERARRSAYLQFVPQQVISLMGVATIDEVTKTTTSSMEMAVMDVSIRFPEHLYRGDPRVLFENINEVIERTSVVLTRHGGTIYNFTSEGYDAVFQGETEAAVSAAVEMRQEILALNEARAKTGGAAVELRIALDRGNIIMGVVGDDSHMVPTAISACLDVTRRLLALAKPLDATILCTLPVAEAAEGYRARYIGKARDGDDLLRVYELFDGDPYAVRTAKEKTQSQFGEGVLTLYTGEFAKAKRIFMDIARYYSADGVTRHYLYLADKYEEEPPEEIILSTE